MHHPNFWIVAVAFFPPMLVLYLIRRYQHLSQTKLSKRQVRELIKRRKSRARMKKADADRKAWSKAEKGYKKRDPDGFKETKERVEEEKEALREQFEKTSRSRALQDPMAFIDDKRMLLDYTQKNLAALAQHQMAQRTQQFTALAAKLDALRPLKVLGRGYAVARNEQGQILRAAQEAAAGEKIEVLLGQGSLNCTVNACNMGGNDNGKNV